MIPAHIRTSNAQNGRPATWHVLVLSMALALAGALLPTFQQAAMAQETVPQASPSSNPAAPGATAAQMPETGTGADPDIESAAGADAAAPEEGQAAPSTASGTTPPGR